MFQEQGRSFAIPVEYVRCVPRLNRPSLRRTLRAAMAHLKDLSPCGGLMNSQERYKLHLPATFLLWTSVLDLKEEHQFR